MKLRNLFVVFIALFTVFVSCGEKTEPEVFDVEFNLPSSITFEEDDDRVVEFKVLFKKAPKTTDVMVLKAGTTIVTCPIISATESKFSVQFPMNLLPATYDVVLKRDAQEKAMGSVKVVINTAGGFKPAASTTVWGVVRSGTTPLKGVVVSDGVEVDVTDDNGIYELNSEKRWGYVFVSLPSGYEAECDGVLPKFHHALESAADIVEQVDFELVKVDGQDNYKMLFFGDMHLADRTSDRAQFSEFTADVKRYIASHPNEKFYAITLGDMTWDLYWYSRGYEFPHYIAEINNGLKGLPMFHTMGNHDNDFKAYNDFDAAFKYVRDVCPTYYSFNIGKVHYVVLDDIDCSKYDGTEARLYSKSLSQEQLDWLKKDLAHVDKGTPVVVTAHAQFFYPDNEEEFKVDHSAQTTSQFLNLLKGYETHIVTGHTHTIFNALPEETAALGADNVFEHNAGAVCASWWWSGHLTDGIHVGTDGTPGGYSIWDVNGTDFKWKYKATNWDEDYQFRAYDLNNVSFSFNDVPKMANVDKVTKSFERYVNAYPGTQDNEVLINIWNWNSDWTLTVTDESGKQLNWTKTYAYDPLHIAALSVKRFNSSSLTSVPSFVTEASMPHFFKVKLDDPNTDIVIKATDEFGNVYTENMARPKEFAISEYKK